MFSLIFAGILMVPAVLIGIKLMGPINGLFARIWEDPRDRQARELAMRLKELHIDGAVPEETAVLMAASEKSATEKEVLDTLGAISTKDAVGMLTGKRSIWGVIFSGIEKSARRRR